MINRSAEDKKKLMEMPVAKDIRKEMEDLANKLEVLAIEQQEYVDKITYLQLEYKVYIHAELSESEAVLFKQLGLKLGKTCKFQYKVKDNEDSQKK